MKFKYPAIQVTPKTGRERFTSNGDELTPTLGDFWSWYASDLVTNSLRGVLAEFIVAMALGLNTSTRLEWDDIDLTIEGNKGIEVKSAAYLQSWPQDKLSAIRFSIAPTKGWNATTNQYHPEKKRRAHVYVFCLLTNKEQTTLNPLNLDQWEFYAASTRLLDREHAKQKTIGLGAIRRLDPRPCRYERLKQKIEDCLAGK